MSLAWGNSVIVLPLFSKDLQLGNENVRTRNGTLQEVSHGPSTCGPETPKSRLPVWITLIAQVMIPHVNSLEHRFAGPTSLSCDYSEGPVACNDSVVSRPFVSNLKFAFLGMISTGMQRVLKLLRILRFVRDYIVSRAGGFWSLFIAFLGRRMSELRRSGNRKPGTSQNPRAAEPLLPGNRATYSASGGSEYVVAASTVPGQLAARASSASLPVASFQVLPPSPTGTSIRLSVHQPRPLYGRNLTASSSGNLSGSSAQSRASERLSTIVNSTELLHAPVDQPSRPARGVYRQFEPGVNPSTSRGQLARAPLFPSYRLNITHSDSHLASHPHDADEGRSPVVHPSSPFSMRGPLTNRNMRNGSSTSINLSIESPSTILTEESMPVAMDPAHATPPFSAVDPSEAASQHSTIASSAISEFDLPESRFLQMIHSDQIPRYENATT